MNAVARGNYQCVAHDGNIAYVQICGNQLGGGGIGYGRVFFKPIDGSFAVAACASDDVILLARYRVNQHNALTLHRESQDLDRQLN